jgi:hypothetical protein
MKGENVEGKHDEHHNTHLSCGSRCSDSWKTTADLSNERVAASVRA